MDQISFFFQVTTFHITLHHKQFMSIITLQYCCNATTIRDATQSVHEWCPLGRILWPSGTRPKRRLFLELFTTPTIDDDDVSQVVQHPPRVIVCVLLEPHNCLSTSSVSDDSQPQRMTRVPMPRDLSGRWYSCCLLYCGRRENHLPTTFWHLQLPRLEGGQCNYNNNNNCNHNAPSQFSHTTHVYLLGNYNRIIVVNCIYLGIIDNPAT